MDIIGNGVDIVENKRIEKSLKIKGFIKRVFTKSEINKSKKLKNKTSYYAKRFDSEFNNKWKSISILSEFNIKKYILLQIIKHLIKCYNLLYN